MHIRHLVCTDNFAGVERYVASTAVELARRGHTVDVIGGAPREMRTLFEGSGVRFVAASSVAGVAHAALARPRPDLVHTHMTAADTAAILAKPLLRRPVISTLHFAQPRGHDALTRRVYGLFPRLVTAEIAISATVAEAVGRTSANPNEGPTVILNGVPEPATSWREAERARVVLVAQRLESEKDTATAIEAFAASGLATQGWEMHVAGEGSELEALQARVQSLDLAGSVTWLGRVDDVDARMSRAGMFLATAPHEPFGLSVVEAMAHGLAVVAADGGAHRETIGSATPETLFAPGDAPAAGALLADLADDSVRRGDLGARARRRYEDAFTIERHVDALEAFYRRVLDD